MRALWSLAPSFARVIGKSARAIPPRSPKTEQNERYCSRKECEIYYISSGLGIWGAKIRIGTRSECLVLDIVPE